MTAIREVFEETGLLLAAKAGISVGSRASDHGLANGTKMDRAREAIHSQKQLFKDFLNLHGLELDLSLLWPFTQWVTPATMVR